MNFKQLYERLIQRVSSDINKSIDVTDKGVATSATILDMPIGDMMIKLITEFNDAVKKLCNFKDGVNIYSDNELILYKHNLSNKHDGTFYGNFDLCFEIRDLSPTIYPNFIRVGVYYGQKNIGVYFGQVPKIEDSDIAKSDTYIVYEKIGETQAANFRRVYKINDLSGVVKLDRYDELFKLIKIMYDNRYEISNYYEINNYYVQSIDDIIEQDKGAYIDKFMIPLLEKNNYDYTIE